MRILVCAPNFPFPPSGGGRADVWRRIEAFIRLGHQVMLLNPYEPRGPKAPTAEALAAVDQVVDARYSFAIKRSRSRTARQLLNIRRIPWHAATRVPSTEERRDLDRVLAEFDPTLVWLDSPWFGELGLELHERGIPMAYRSHNLEHDYLRKQAASTSRRRDQIAWRLASVGVKNYQLKLMAAANAVFDISLNDMVVWRRLGVSDIRWLPPLPQLALTGPSPDRVSTDVLFVGGLRTPNNVQGVRWLVERIVPLLHHHRPDIKVGIVGSYPDPDLTAELAANPAIRTYYDVPDVTPYQFGARVLVNPVSVGSGVQLKMLDMLMTDAPIVTRSQGTRGLPPACTREFDVADDEEEFAAAILRRLADPSIDLESRTKARELFTMDAVENALATIKLA